MRVRISIVLVALMVPLLLPGAVGARSAESAAKAEHNRIVNYWTAERLASAKAKDFVRTESGKLVPRAKPGGGGAGGAVKGASWTGNGAIEQRSGKLYFSTSGGNWQCSASVANSSASGSQAVILTAGHCLYDGSEGWSFNVVYIPNFDDAPTGTCSQTIYGCWTATRLAINSDFYPSGFGPEAALRVDYGFALMGPGGKAGTSDLDAVTGSYGLKTSGVSLSEIQWAFGYPAAGRYNGKDLVYCKGSTINDPNGVGTWGMACNMTGGSSGGPWLWGTTNPADGSGLLSSVNSYGYQGLAYMFGPRFNGETTTVLGDAVDGSQTNGTSVVH